jgi:hypothetical protein
MCKLIEVRGYIQGETRIAAALKVNSSKDFFFLPLEAFFLRQGKYLVFSTKVFLLSFFRSCNFSLTLAAQHGRASPFPCVFEQIVWEESRSFRHAIGNWIDSFLTSRSRKVGRSILFGKGRSFNSKKHHRSFPLLLKLGRSFLFPDTYRYFPFFILGRVSFLLWLFFIYPPARNCSIQREHQPISGFFDRRFGGVVNAMPC